MTLLDPERLLLILLPLALGGVYVVLQQRRTRYALRFSSIDLFDGVAPDRPGWRRHLAAAVYLAALSLLIFGLARPVMAVEVPNTPTIMLAVDVSYSMNATDVSPTRLAAAEAAAERFVDVVPAGTRVGLLAFASTAQVVVSPTDHLDTVRTAIHQLHLGPGTAIGEAIYAALDQLPKAAAGTAATPAPSATTGASDGNQPAAPQAGAIVLLSDGQTTVGRPESQAAKAAAAAGVHVSTIAFGTASGTVTVQGETVSVPVDAAALQAVAQTTGGQFFTAATADQVRAAFEDIGKAVGTTTQDREMTDYVVAAALGAAVIAAGASLAWFSRLP
ncbi:MAG TPA: VWA domain-containing protein [Candidatus Dormibacteraeota bacterium]|nr:VWA domain-containing protein [Candidatus Dormibacteraeota bacterium]